MMTITLNLTNWVKSGMIPTATEVPMDPTGDINYHWTDTKSNNNTRMLMTAQETISKTAQILLVTTFTRHAKNIWTQEAIIP
jgi:hypothetical protein